MAGDGVPGNLGGSNLNKPPQTRLIKPKTKKGLRVLESRAPKAVEDAKRALLLYGNAASQVMKDLLTDLRRLKGTEAVKFTRKNEDVRPFEPGGETSLEFYASRTDASLFVLASHSKKRPNNLVLGRLFDGRLYDALEFGVEGFSGLHAFKAATAAQVGNKPAILFVGEKFESIPALSHARSLLLDFFRGESVSSINLGGLDRVVVATAADDKSLLLRQYSIRFRKSGGRVPKVALAEMGPRLDLALRRQRIAPADLAAEAMRQAKLGKKKEKNVHSDDLAGKVGRIYIPAQKMDTVALSKPKGVRREKRQAAAAASPGEKMKRARLNSGAAKAAAAVAP